MAHDNEQAPENQPQLHHHSCGNLFGCGDEKGTGVFRDVDIVRGVHAMIPKSLFTGDLRKQIAVV